MGFLNVGGAAEELEAWHGFEFAMGNSQHPSECQQRDHCDPDHPHSLLMPHTRELFNTKFPGYWAKESIGRFDPGLDGEYGLREKRRGFIPELGEQILWLLCDCGAALVAAIFRSRRGCVAKQNRSG